jgi:hypothetical protein
VIERAELGRIIRDDKFRLIEPSGLESAILDIDNREPRELTHLPHGAHLADGQRWRSRRPSDGLLNAVESHGRRWAIVRLQDAADAPIIFPATQDPSH